MKERSHKTILEIFFFLFFLSMFLIFGLHGYNSTSAKPAANVHHAWGEEEK